MKFETLIVLVIAFNIVTAVLKQRAKKKAGAAQPNPRPRQTTSKPNPPAAKKILESKLPDPRPIEPKPVELKHALPLTVATVQRPATMDLPLDDLRDPKRVRAALVLREILGKPVSMRHK